jgi:hypothetical protein
MKNYRILNNLTGWVVWFIATIVYLLTIEPTASWWDCGEYIATAYKLQVGHPPGAPFFQLLGRIFSLFAFGDVSNVALMINIMSALSSSFTILFLFWSITIFAKKAALMNGGEMTDAKMFAVFGSGIVGALAYTFSDSFWFSAVEGEVYAMSSFFTAIVLWAILRWEEVAEEQHSSRWLILIAYLVGLSVGVHLLNLLAIPAIAFVYYFKKYKPTTKGMLLTGGISIFVLAIIMFGIIPEVVSLFAHTELLFVNGIGLPFNSGTIFLVLLFIATVIFGIRATHEDNPMVTKLALIFSGILYLLILTESTSAGSFFIRFLVGAAAGYGIYSFRLQRAQINNVILSLVFILIGYSSFLIIVIRANTNTPINENSPEDAVSLLSYLNREQYGDWPIFMGQYYNSPVSDYGDGNPVYMRNDEKGKYVIVDDRKGIVPVYDKNFTTIFPRMWSNQKSLHIKEYKRWGDVQGRPMKYTKPDGTTENIPKPTFGENLQYFFKYQLGHMYFRYFMWNYSGRQNDIQGHGEVENGNWITGFSGVDSARLGNQSELPPSMQNEANNKFYLLPLILGLIGLFFHLNRDYKNAMVVGLMFLMTGIAIVVYLNQYPYQPRERDYAYAGSTYAFAMWIGLGVFALFNFLSKYLNPKMSAIAVTAATLILVPGIMASEGWDDHDRSGKYAARDFAINYLESCEPNAILFTNGDNDTFPLWYVQEVEGIRTDVRVVNYMLASGEWYIHQMMRKIYDSDPLPFTLSEKQYDKGSNNYVPFYERGGLEGATELSDVINFIASEDSRTKLPLNDGSSINYSPTKNLKLTINKEYLLRNGLVRRDLADRIVPEISWQVKQNYLYKNDLMLLDFIATNNWKRPVYFTSPSAIENVMNVDKYCHLEGIVYRFLPVVAENYIEGLGGVDSKGSFELLVNKAKWGNLDAPDTYIDPESRRNSVMPKQNYMRLAQTLIDEKKMDSAVRVLDACQKFFPNNKMIYDIYMMPIVEAYYQAGAAQKGNEVSEILFGNFEADLDYYSKLGSYHKKYYDQDIQRAFAVLQQLSMLAKRYKQTDLSMKIDTYVNMQIEKF